MIWFDWLPERKLADDDIRRALAAVTGCAYHEVEVVDDIADLADAPVTCLVASQSNDNYGQQLSIYLGDEASTRVRTVSIGDAAAQLARTVGSSVLIADDETANPYRMIRFDADGRRESVRIDSAMFDDLGVVRLVV